MTKRELCRQIYEDMLEEELLNETDACNITTLQREVEKLIGKRLEDYLLVYKMGVIED
jgi:hypothetical protein